MRVSNNSKKLKREQKEAREDFMYGVLRMKTELEFYKKKFEEEVKISPTQLLVGETLYEIYSKLTDDETIQGLELILDESLEKEQLTFR